MSSQIIPVRYFAEQTAEWIIAEARAVIAAQGLFRLALAGGNTPRAVHESLAPRGADLLWSHVQRDAHVWLR